MQQTSIFPSLRLLVIGLCLAACAGRRAAPVASPLDTGALTPVPLVQRLTVVAYADPRWQLLPNHRDRIGQRIDATSDQLLARVGIRLDLREVRPWPTAVNDIDRALDALEAEEAARDADLVLLFTANPVRGRADLALLEGSRYTGRYAVVRSLTPYLGDDPVWLHAGEVALVQRAIARIHGALRICGAGVMGAGAGLLNKRREAWAWHPRTLALVRAHARLTRLQRKVPPDAAKAALEALRPTGPCDRVAVEARRKVLTALATPPAPDNADRIAAGEAALAAGKPREALELCAPVAEATPEQGAGCAGHAALAADEPIAGIRFLRAHLAHHPADEAAVLALARAVGREGDDAAARSLLARYVERNPEHVEARLNLGVSLARMGDYAAARRAWERVLELAPGHPGATKMLSRLP